MSTRGIRALAALVVLAILASCGGGQDNGTGPGSVLTVTLRNNHSAEIQIAAPNESFGDGTRIPPGGSRVASVSDAPVGGNVTFRVGRSNQQIAIKSCPMARDTRNPEVHWDGSDLQCIRW